MCGRFAVTATPQALAETFDLGETLPVSAVFHVTPRYNVAPGQPVLAVRMETAGPLTGARAPVMLHWGLVPSWSREPVMARPMINARAETAPDKPSFRYAWRRRRCLIPADAYYEWRRTGRGREAVARPYAFALRDGETMGLAALWDRHEAADGSVLDSCAILTVAANALAAPVHDRMPLILERRDHALWLDPRMNDAERLKGLARPYPAEAMRRWAVSTRINRPEEDGPACLAPVDEPDANPPAGQPTLF